MVVQYIAISVGPRFRFEVVAVYVVSILRSSCPRQDLEISRSARGGIILYSELYCLGSAPTSRTIGASHNPKKSASQDGNSNSKMRTKDSSLATVYSIF